MTFHSLEFLVFFPIVLLFYFCIPTKYRRIPLLIASYWFYACWNFRLLGLILLTTAVAYGAGLLLEKTESPRARKLLLTLTLVVCLGVLFVYKYLGFFAHTVQAVSSLVTGKPAFDLSLSLILPVGISFYTFQTLSYVIDVYRRKIGAERDLLYFALFVAFFPQLVAGPIERPENLLPQLKAPHSLTSKNFREGAAIMLIGYFKKIAVADMLAPHVNAVFNHASDATGPSVVLASVLFALQIYCDFSGYTDIAIGCARVMDIRLMQNFDRPYAAQSIRDFWSRWHISLTSWFRDYLYIPLGGSRRSKARTLLNVLIVFAVSGLWHGANLTFVLWGLLHGLYQIAERLAAPLRARFFERSKLDENAPWLRALRRFGTFVLVTFAWIFFRANSLSDLRVLLGKLFCAWNGAALTDCLPSMGIGATSAVLTVLSVFVLILLDRRAAKKKDGAEALRAFSAVDSLLYIWLILAAWLLVYAQGGASTFIYFQF